MTHATSYTVSLRAPHTRLIEVEGRFATAGRAQLELVMPVWTPGSYLVREYARHLQDFTAVDESGRALEHTRTDKRTFQILTAGARSVTARWKVYANDLTVRAAHFDDTHAHFAPAAVFLHDEQVRGEPHQVTLDAPEGWRTHVALPREGESPSNNRRRFGAAPPPSAAAHAPPSAASEGGGAASSAESDCSTNLEVFVAADLDALIDSPFHVGPEAALAFTAAGKPHELVIWGQGNFDPKRLTADLARICETEAKLFGGLPFERYLFILLLTDKGRGGLEHQASTSLLYPRFGFQPQKSYEELLTLAAHEYFHLWNVKRIKPAALVPFDYSKESYTALLWAMEGITSYYDTLLVRRAGLMGGARYLERMGENLSALAQTPGRLVQGLDEASRCAWVKYYRPDENSANSGVSYYLKGELVAMLLDLEIRRRTDDAKSLDDVMRLLWQRFGDGRGVPERGVEDVASEVAGVSLADFFARGVHAPGELELSALGHVGLEARTRPREGAGDKGGTPARELDPRPAGYLGAVTRARGDRCVVAYALAGSPAYRDGLLADDEVLALDGYKVDAESLAARVEAHAPGQAVALTVFRRDQLRTVAVTLGEKPHDALWIARRSDATPAQKRAYESWLGEAWPD